MSSMHSDGLPARVAGFQATREDDHFVLTADLPGVDPGSVDVDVDNGHIDDFCIPQRAERRIRAMADQRAFLRQLQAAALAG